MERDRKCVQLLEEAARLEKSNFAYMMNAYPLIRMDCTPNEEVIDDEVPDTVWQIVASLIPQKHRYLLKKMTRGLLCIYFIK